MKAEIKSLYSLYSLYSLELEGSLTQYQPDDASNFGIWMRARIGPENEAGSEFFDILVCTSDWLREQCAEGGPRWGRHMPIGALYELDAIESFLVRYVAQCNEIDCPSIATKLSRIEAWEFEDYQS